MNDKFFLAVIRYDFNTAMSLLKHQYHTVKARFDSVKRGNFILNIACEHGHLEFVKLLLEIKSVRDNAHSSGNCNYALTLASMNGHLEVVKCLLEIRSVRDKAERALTWAYKNGRLEVVKCLLDIKSVRDYVNSYPIFHIRFVCDNANHAVAHLFLDVCQNLTMLNYVKKHFNNVYLDYTRRTIRAASSIAAWSHPENTYSFLPRNVCILIGDFIPGNKVSRRFNMTVDTIRDAINDSTGTTTLLRQYQEKSENGHKRKRDNDKFSTKESYRKREREGFDRLSDNREQKARKQNPKRYNCCMIM